MGRLGTIGADNSSSEPPRAGSRLGILKVSQKELDEVAKKKRQDEGNARIAKTQEELKKAQADVWSPGSIIGELGKATATVGKAIAGAGKSLIVDPAVNLVNQARISTKIKDEAATPALVKNQSDYLDSEVKKGTITKDKAEQEKTRLKAKETVRTESVKKAEKEVGVKANSTEGVLGLIDTVGNLTGLGGIGKALLTKATETASKRLGRDLTKDEVENLAKKTKEIAPENPPQPTLKPEPVAPEPEAVTIKSGHTLLEEPLQLSRQADAVAPETVPRKTSPVKTVTLKQGENGVDVADLATKAKNTLPEPELGVRNPAVEQAKLDIKNGTVKPVQVHTSPEGELTIKSGAETVQAAKELGLKSIPIEDVSNKDVLEPVTGVQIKDATPKPAGDTVSGNAARIEQTSLEKKLTDKMGDLPQYKSISMKEQAKEAVDLVTNNRQHALDVIEGRANPPGNLKPQSVHQALEDLAIKEGDGELLTKLAKSNINTELSESAQNLRIAAERDPHSAVEQIRQVRDARLKVAERRAKTTVSKEKNAIKSKVVALTPKVKKETWASFIKELEC